MRSASIHMKMQDSGDMTMVSALVHINKKGPMTQIFRNLDNIVVDLRKIKLKKKRITRTNKLSR